jgi:hypothetical protein
MTISEMSSGEGRASTLGEAMNFASVKIPFELI